MGIRKRTAGWLDPILSKLLLRVGPWKANKPTRVINANPAEGELPVYHADVPTTSSQRPEVHVLLSMIVGIEGRRRLLLINGLSTEGTQIGQEFLTHPMGMRRPLAALRGAASKVYGRVVLPGAAACRRPRQCSHSCRPRHSPRTVT